MKRIVLVAALIACGIVGAQEFPITPIAPPAVAPVHIKYHAPKSPFVVRNKTASAECGCETQCEAMWAAVPDALQSSTHMRVRMVSDNYAATYAPYRGQFGVMAGRSTKKPKTDGGYRIEAEFDSRYGDGDDMQAASRLFYTIVNGSAIGIQCPV